MPSPNAGVPIGQLLEAARMRVAETGLRAAAAEMEVDYSTLSKLLKRDDGPRASTVAKLTTWYIKRVAAGQFEISPELAAAALGVLVQHLSERDRAAAEAQLTDALRSITESRGVAVPRWLR